MVVNNAPFNLLLIRSTGRTISREVIKSCYPFQGVKEAVGK